MKNVYEVFFALWAPSGVYVIANSFTEAEAVVKQAEIYRYNTIHRILKHENPIIEPTP